MGSPTVHGLEGALAAQSYYIVLPDAIAGSDLVAEQVAGLGLRLADSRALDHVIASAVLAPREGWEDLSADVALLASGSAEAGERLGVAISKRRKFIQAALAETSFSANGEGGIECQGERVVPPDEEHVLTLVLRTSKTAQDQKWVWINGRAQEDGGVVVLGDEPGRADPTKYQILRPALPEDITAADITPGFIQREAGALARDAARRVVVRERISREQERVGVPRETFVWSGNDMIGRVRSAASEAITAACQRFRSSGVTEFDVATQVMMHLPTLEPTELWQGDNATVQRICDLLREERGAEANDMLAQALSTGAISLNMELVGAEVTRHAEKLAAHYDGLSVTLNGAEVRLPAAYMGDPELNPFKGMERTEIDARGSKIANEGTPDAMMVVTERHSGRRITFKAIPPEISKLYSLGFSNLHYARDGEVAAFGAFLEDDELPFAYSSYSPISRQYTTDMLTHSGIDPATILESTRAWNAPWAPENTMSTLFAFCHAALRAQRAQEIKAGTAERELGGVITSINQNLGFKGVSFRGVRFNTAAIKPTGFSYVRNDDGTADFMSKGDIRKRLGLPSDADLGSHSLYLRPQIPLLPTVELLALFDSNAEKALLARPIYRVTAAASKRG